MTTPRVSYDDIHEIEGSYLFETVLLSKAKQLFPDCDSNITVAEKFMKHHWNSSAAWRNCSTNESLRFTFNHQAQGIGLVDMLNNYLVEKAKLMNRALEF